MKVPKHIAIILDGNRRFAKRLMLKPWKGHEYGAKKVEKLFDWCKEYKIKELTVYCLSLENFNRPKEEFDYLMNLFRKEYEGLLKEESKIHENKVKINFVGRLNLLPQDIQGTIKEITEKTKDYDGYTVNFAMAYGGKQEVIDATIKIAEAIKSGNLDIDKINEETFNDNLILKSSPELIIRTGGEKRTSNFLIWQGAYSEWIFLEKMWPEFEKEDFVSCLEEYDARERRFGK
ncbi:MAG: polyprenyl diphosphate synthase [Nanoarchaeota archaeon]